MQQQQEVELFHDYELKGWEFSPRIYKIIGAAAAIHLFAFIVFAQVDLIGTKACDSPYVGKVCQVLDAAYIGSILLGTDTEFASRDYDKTEIDEADVTFIDVSDEFTYPSGYFALSNPAPAAGAYDPTTMTAVMPGNGATFTSPSDIPGFPNFGPTTTPPVTTLDPNQPAILPTPNPNAVQGTIPDSPLGNVGGGNPTVKIPRAKIRRYPTTRLPKVSNNSPIALPSDKELADKNAADKNKNQNANAAPKTEDKPAADPNSDEAKLFNKKPLEDFGVKYGEAILNNQVNINAPFAVEVKTKLDENGKFIKPVMVTKPGSDEKMTELAKEAIAAFGDSQLLSKLYDVGGRNVTIRFEQNQDNLQAIILTETESDNRAKTLAGLLNLVIKNAGLKEGSDEDILMKKAQFSTQGKVFIINFLIPNDEKTSMIKKNLEKLQEKLKNQKPNSGVAETVNNDAKTAK